MGDDIELTEEESAGTPDQIQAAIDDARHANPNH